MAGLWTKLKSPSTDPLIRRLDLALIFVVVAFVNFGLFRQGIAAHNSDQWVYPLGVNEIVNEGRWRPFPIGLSYGGMGPSMVRLLWIFVGQVFGGEKWVWETGHTSFAYFITPFVVALSFYIMGRVLFRRFSALLIGLLAAFGFQIWTHFGGIDTYTLFIIVGPLSVAARAKLFNPMESFSRVKLFWVSVLFGFLTYNFYACLLSMMVFFFPWEHLRKGWVEFWNKGSEPFDKVDLTLRSLSFLLFGLWIFLVFNGRELGQIAGRPILLDAYPNLQLMAGVLLVFFVRRFRSSLTREFALRFGILAGGWVLGMFPEWVNRFSFHDEKAIHSIEVSYERFPHALHELVYGFLWTPYDGVSRWFLSVLLGFCFGALVWVMRQKNAFEPYRMGLITCLGLFLMNSAAFFRISASSPGAARYLLSCFPLLFFVVGLGSDLVLSLRNRAMRIGGVFVFGICFLGTCGFFFLQKQAVVHRLATEERVLKIREISEALIGLGVSFAASDDVWESVTYTMGTQGKVKVIYPGGPFPDWDPTVIRKSASIGLLLTKKPENPFKTSQKMRLELGEKQRVFESDWVVADRRQVGGFEVYRLSRD